MNAIRLAGNFLSLTLLIGVPAANAQAGLFDFFNPSAPEPPRVTIERPADLPPIITPLPLHHVEPQRRISIVHRDPADKGLILTGQSADLQKDGTLREGDAVMTKSGIRIFAGTSQGQHRANEFAKLDEAKGLTSTEQAALAAIDSPAKDTNTSGEALVTGRSSAANTGLAWKWVRDPKGRLVRYVGP